MKKYLAPNAKFIHLDAEHNMMISGSLNSGETAEGGDAMSNERTTSSFIWGDED